MRTVKDNRITIRQVESRYQDNVGAWHDGPKVDTVVWANLRGMKHSSYIAAHSEMEQPSMVATFALPRGLDLTPGDEIVAVGKVFEITHIDFLEMTPGGDVRCYCKEIGRE